jgi:hypothetical protein
MGGWLNDDEWDELGLKQHMTWDKDSKDVFFLLFGRHYLQQLGVQLARMQGTLLIQTPKKNRSSTKV